MDWTSVGKAFTTINENGSGQPFEAFIVAVVNEEGCTGNERPECQLMQKGDRIGKNPPWGAGF